MPNMVLTFAPESYILELRKNCNNGVHLVCAGIAVKQPGFVARRPVICRKLGVDPHPWIVWWQCFEDLATLDCISETDRSYMHQGSYCSTLAEALVEFNRRHGQALAHVPMMAEGLWVKP